MPAITSLDLSNAKLDVDHIAAIATSTAPAARDRLGNIKDTVVGAVATIAAINPRGVWVTGTMYSIKDVVLVSSVFYICVIPHTSSASFASDENVKWRVYQGATKADLQSTIYLGLQLTAFGDSFTAGITGSGSYSPDNYANFISADTGIPLVNKAISSSLIIDLGSNFYNTSVGPSDTFFSMTGYNDGRVYGGSAGGLFTYKGVLEAMLVYLAIPDSNKTLAISTDITYSGTWSVLTGVYANKNTSKFTLAPSSTATTTFSGNVLYIGHTRSPSTPAVFNVNIGGRDYGNFTNSAYTASNSGLAYGPSVLRIPGLPSTKKQVVIITHVSGGEFYLDYVAGNGGGSVSVPSPRVFSGNTVRMVNYSGELSSDAVVDKYNFAHSSVIASLIEDGLNIMKVDTSSGYDVVAYTGADQVHPNSDGERYLADTFLKAMSSASMPIDRNRQISTYSKVPGLYSGHLSTDFSFSPGSLSNVLFDSVSAPPGWVYLPSSNGAYFPQTPGYVEMSVTLTFKGPLLAGRYYMELLDQDNGMTYTLHDSTITAQTDALTVSGSLIMYADGVGTRFSVRVFTSATSKVAAGFNLTRFNAKFLGQ